jgi:hypothetical protein
MKNTTKRLIHPKQYQRIAQQMGKMDVLFNMIQQEPDISKAIGLARSMRGHVAMILKNLHAIKKREGNEARIRPTVH